MRSRTTAAWSHIPRTRSRRVSPCGGGATTATARTPLRRDRKDGALSFVDGRGRRRRQPATHVLVAGRIHGPGERRHHGIAVVTLETYTRPAFFGELPGEYTRHLLVARCRREPAGEVVEVAQVPRRGAAFLDLAVHAAGKVPGDRRYQEEQQQRVQVGLVADFKGVVRRSEQEVERQEAEQTGKQGRAQASVVGRNEHREQEDQRQARMRHDPMRRQCDQRTRQGERDGREVGSRRRTAAH
ncbi:MAG: hypothetical protein M5U09_04170 [Gammaproteobacteria bacterium]|nr:hypothetical protein [Gammaproteobacteria bacterium]